LFEGWADRRDLFVLRHPWAASESNRCGTVWQEVHIATNWPGRLRLWFYESDDYFGASPELTNGWLGQIKLVGHRFKQVLADDVVIWEKDGGQRHPSNLAGTGPPFSAAVSQSA
jgi:hypothetical protein